MFNLNYVSSPKLVLSQKVLLMSAACVSKFRSFWSFQTKQHMGSFYATPCTTDCIQMLYKLAKTEFPCRIQCLIAGKYTAAVIPKMLYIVYAAPPMTASERRSTPMTSDVSRLWRHSSWVRSRTLERACRRPFLTFLGKFEPQNAVGHGVHPKKAFPYITSRVLSYRASKSIQGWLQ